MRRERQHIADRPAAIDQLDIFGAADQPVDRGQRLRNFVTTEVLTHLRARDFLPQQGTNRKELERFLANPK